MKDRKIKSRENKAITLIALIITVIIMLILAGIALNFAIGEKGIFHISQKAGENYKEAQDKELADLENLYSSMLIATNDDAQITVNVEDLKKIIQAQVEEKVKEEVEGKVKEEVEKQITGIGQNSLLLTAENNNLNVGKIRLNSFTNTFTDESSKYFEYNATTGELTCLESGWFIVDMFLNMNATGNTSVWSGTEVCTFVNDIKVLTVGGTVYQGNGCYIRDSNAINVYLKKGDKLSVEKNTTNSKVGQQNYAYVEIKKM